MRYALIASLVIAASGCLHDNKNVVHRNVYDTNGRLVATIDGDNEEYGAGRTDYRGEAEAEAIKQQAAAQSDGYRKCMEILDRALAEDEDIIFVNCDSYGHASLEKGDWMYTGFTDSGVAAPVRMRKLHAQRGSRPMQRNAGSVQRIVALQVSYPEEAPEPPRRRNRDTSSDDNRYQNGNHGPREPVLTDLEIQIRDTMFEAEVACDGYKSDLLKMQVDANKKIEESPECQSIREQVTAFHEFEAAKSLKAKEQLLLNLRRLIDAHRADPPPAPPVSGPVPAPALGGKTDLNKAVGK